jgi:hypothetical protein
MINLVIIEEIKEAFSQYHKIIKDALCSPEELTDYYIGLFEEKEASSDDSSD